MFKLVFKVMALGLFMTNLSFSQAGFLDLNFSKNGVDTLSFGSTQTGAIKVVSLPNGKILQFSNSGIAPSQWFNITRHNPNGTLDATFGKNGKVDTSFGGIGSYISEAKVLADNKIIVVGEYFTNASPLNGKILLGKFNANGKVDTTFGVKGRANINVSSIRNYAWTLSIFPDSSYLLGGSINNAGSRDYLIVKVKKNGSVDSTFGTNGFITKDLSIGDDINHSTVDSKGNAYFAANTKTGNNRYDFVVIKSNSTGLGTSFGTNGILTIQMGNNDATPYRIAITPSGKILLGGQVVNASGYYDYGFVRVLPNGTLDNTFGSAGKAINSFGSQNDGLRDLLVLPNGRILASGFSQTVSGTMFANVVKFDSSGNVVTSFGTNGSYVLNTGVSVIYNTNQGQIPYTATLIAPLYSDTNTIFVTTGAKYGSKHVLALFKIGTSTGILTANNMDDFTASPGTGSDKAYPNPFESNTSIEYLLSSNDQVSIDVVNMNGLVVKTLVNNEFRPAGVNSQLVEIPESAGSGTFIIKIKSSGQPVKHIKVVRL